MPLYKFNNAFSTSVHHVAENMMKFERRILNSVVGIEVGKKMIKKKGSEIVKLWIFGCFCNDGLAGT
jgi:hypothetical protein